MDFPISYSGSRTFAVCTLNQNLKDQNYLKKENEEAQKVGQKLYFFFRQLYVAIRQNVGITCEKEVLAREERPQASPPPSTSRVRTSAPEKMTWPWDLYNGPYPTGSQNGSVLSSDELSGPCQSLCSVAAESGRGKIKTKYYTQEESLLFFLLFCSFVFCEKHLKSSSIIPTEAQRIIGSQGKLLELPTAQFYFIFLCLNPTMSSWRAVN